MTTSNRLLPGLFALLLAVLAIPGVAFATEQTGKIRGTVVDEIVLGGGPSSKSPDRDYENGGNTSRETRQMIIEQLGQLSKANRGNNLEIL